jgi:hypothetical protein
MPSDALAETFLYLHEMEAISHTCDRALEDVKRRNGGKKIASALHQSHTPFVDLPPEDFTSHYRRYDGIRDRFIFLFVANHFHIRIRPLIIHKICRNQVIQNIKRTMPSSEIYIHSNLLFQSSANKYLITIQSTSKILSQITVWVSVLLMLKSRTQDMLRSNLGHDTGYPH